MIRVESNGGAKEALSRFKHCVWKLRKYIWWADFSISRYARQNFISYAHLNLLFLVAIIILNFVELALQYHLISQYFKAFVYNIFQIVVPSNFSKNFKVFICHRRVYRSIRIKWMRKALFRCVAKGRRMGGRTPPCPN